MAGRRPKFAWIALSAAAVAGGCVTETRPTARSGDPATRDGAGLPGQPVARPLAGAVTNTRITVGVRPIGSVPYDGVVLPLVSPDGKLLAVEQGTAPGWPALLATDDAVLPLATTLAVYDLGVSPPKRVEFVE